MQKVGVTMVHLANTQHASHVMSEMMRKTGQVHVPGAQHEMKLAAKEDLKMTDLLKYYRADSEASKDLLSRRVKVRPLTFLPGGSLRVGVCHSGASLLHTLSEVFCRRITLVLISFLVAGCCLRSFGHLCDSPEVCPDCQSVWFC